VDDRETHAAVRIPWALGLIATRSLDEQVTGIHELVEISRARIRRGVQAHAALQALRANPDDADKRGAFKALSDDLGFGLLTLRYVDDPAKADEAVIERAAWSTVPNVPVLFWSFRIMVGLGCFFIALFGYAFYLASTRKLERPRFLRLALWSLPLPWIAAELGWVVAEYGRQPWAIDGVLPTFLGVSSTSTGQVTASLIGFLVLYSGLAIVDVTLMRRVVRAGPDGLDFWPLRKRRNTGEAIAAPSSLES